MLKRLIVSVVAWIMVAAPPVAAEIQITVYNDDLALVRETRSLNYQRGVFELKFADVAAAIDPTSVTFAAPGQADAVALLEQNFRYDLVSVDKLLEKYIDRDIRVITKQDKLHEGSLLASDPGAFTLMNSDGGLTVVNREEVADVSLAELPEGMMTRPTLVWLLDSEVDGPVQSEVTYLTHRIQWHAEYIATVNEAEDGLSLAGWVSIDNRSGATYKDAKIKLMAGDVSRVEERRKGVVAMDAMMARAAPGFEQQEFFEYHLYTLGRPSTIHDNEIKQLTLFEPARVAAHKVFTYFGAQDGSKVRVTMEFKNSESAGLGMPLPKGKIRAMKASSDGALEFIGEDMIDHTPRDEEVRVYLGNAFDVVGERTQLDRQKITDRVYDESFQVELRNHKKDNITVVVVEHFWGDWEISETTYDYDKKDARTAEWRIPIPADGTAKLTYTVRHRT